MVKFGANPSMRFVPCLTGLFNVAIHDIQGFGLVPPMGLGPMSAIPATDVPKTQQNL